MISSEVPTKWEYTQPESEDRMHSITGGGLAKGEWVDIQERAFTAWVNRQLSRKDPNLKISSLLDFKTGERLLQLVEVVANTTFRIPSSTFNMRIHHLSNVDKALSYLTQKAGVTLVNVGAADIVDGHRDIMLGLIWTLIQKYELRLSRGELLAWTREMLQAVGSTRIANFTTDWNSGKALCALVAACAPGSIGAWISVFLPCLRFILFIYLFIHPGKLLVFHQCSRACTRIRFILFSFSNTTLLCRTCSNR